MHVTEDLFRKGMRRLGGAVTIVTSSDDEGRWAGLTATAVTSLSAQSHRLLACINRQGGTYDIISRGRTICINVLGVEHLELAKRFAGLSGEPECDRFEEGLWAPILTGAPALTGALVNFDCTVENILDVGTHGIVVAQVKAIEAAGEGFADPLAYIDGTWSTLTPL